MLICGVFVAAYVFFTLVVVVFVVCLNVFSYLRLDPIFEESSSI